MLSSYEFLRSYCGLDKIVSVGSIQNDLLSYYDQTTWNDETLCEMANAVESFISYFWKKYSVRAKKPTKKPKGIKLITPDDGIYPYVLKVDFNRAFINYAVNVMSKPLYRELKKNCYNIARMDIPNQAKKFLYNYILTNLITKYDGFETLYALRQMVYDDVMRLAYRYGDPLKSEVDGCYVKTDKEGFSNIVKYDDIFGSYKILRIWRYNVFDNGKVTVAGLVGGEDNYQIKGIPKLTCNIIADTLAKVVLKNDDKVLDEFFSNQKINVLDWCNKTKEGTEVQILAKGSNVTLKTVNSEDINNLQTVKDVLDRNKYYDLMKAYITQFFDMWGVYGKNK